MLPLTSTSSGRPRRSAPTTGMRTTGMRRTGTTLAVLALVLAPAATSAAAATRMPTSVDGACTDPAGVTVVVDFTDLGGEVEIGCAPEGAATGTEALQAAGFTDTRDASGLICAIDAQPDPCPATFTGSYWSYWSAEPDGAWTAYMEGSDTAVPAAGALEGWRYNDGATGPGVEPAAVAAQASADEPTAEQDAEQSADDTATASDGASDGSGTVWPLAAGAVLLAGVVAAAVVVARRRAPTGDAGPDA